MKNDLMIMGLAMALLSACGGGGGSSSGGGSDEPATAVAPPSAESPVTTPTGMSPRVLALGDFNGDGRIDVAAAAGDPTSGTFRVWLDDGAGGYALWQEWTCDSSVAAVVSGDFNGDGLLDLIVGNRGDDVLGSIRFRAGAGDGTFGAAQTILPVSCVQLAAGDFDLDGDLDLAASSISWTWIFEGFNDGTFSVAQEFDHGSYLAAGDVDADGKMELAIVANLYDTQIQVWRSVITKPVLWATFDAPAGHVVQAMAIADVDHDGDSDIVLGTADDATYESGAIRIWKNTEYSYAATDWTTPAPVKGLDVADFNLDGRVDIAHVEETRLSIAYGQADGTFLADAKVVTGVDLRSLDAVAGRVATAGSTFEVHAGDAQ